MSKQKKRWILLPFGFLYGIAVGIRNWLFDFDILKSREFDIPIISIGNITVGGTGKTPHVEFIISALKEEFKLATLSRGYKRKSKNFRIAETDTPFLEIGDEPKQMKLKFPEIIVAVEKNRVKGIDKLTKEKEDLDVIILDDAYQHRYVKPGINILLIDYNRPLSEDYILPVGTLRERSHRKDRANIIIMTKSPEKLLPIEQRLILKRLNLFPYQNLYFSRFEYKELISVFSDTTLLKEKISEENYSILLVTGIAYTEPLTEHILQYTSDLKHFKYKDHHCFNQKDIIDIEVGFKEIKSDKKIILTTEKDAIRLRENDYISDYLHEYMFYIPIEIVFIKDEEQLFIKQINDYVRKNKRKH